MTVITPPLFLTVGGAYNGDDLGLPYRDVIGAGVVSASDLEVTERAAGANMSVDVAAGVAWVSGSIDADAQPRYRVRNDGTVNLSITAADGSNPRKDIVIAEVRDQSFSGSSDDWRLRVVTGTPAASPAEPSLPDNSLKLAVITVDAAASSITDADITDSRVIARIGEGSAAMKVPTPADSETDYYVIAQDTSPPGLGAGSTWITMNAYDIIDDPRSMLNESTGEITLPVTGLWAIEAELKMADRGAVMRLLQDVGGSLTVPKYSGKAGPSDNPSNYHLPVGFVTIGAWASGTKFRLDVFSTDSSPNPIGTVSEVNFRAFLISAI